MANRGVPGHTEWGAEGEGKGLTGERGREGISLPIGNRETCTLRRMEGGWCQGSLYQSLHCVYLSSALPSVSVSSPSSDSPSAPGVCAADKKEEVAAGSRHGAVWLSRLPHRARARVRGPGCGAPWLPQLLPAFVPSPHTPQQEAFLWGRDGGPAGPGWTEDKDQAG